MTPSRAPAPPDDLERLQALANELVDLLPQVTDRELLMDLRREVSAGQQQIAELGERFKFLLPVQKSPRFSPKRFV